MNQNNSQINKPIGVKNAGFTGGETAIITGELVFSSIITPTKKFTEGSKFESYDSYGLILSNPSFQSDSQAMLSFLNSNMYQSKYNTNAITLSQSTQTGVIKVYDKNIRRASGIELEHELGRQQVSVFIEIYYSTKFATPALAVRGVLIEDEMNINYLMQHNYLAAFGLEANPNPPKLPNRSQPVETFNQNNGQNNSFNMQQNMNQQNNQGLDFGANNQQNNMQQNNMQQNNQGLDFGANNQQNQMQQNQMQQNNMQQNQMQQNNMQQNNQGLDFGTNNQQNLNQQAQNNEPFYNQNPQDSVDENPFA